MEFLIVHHHFGIDYDVWNFLLSPQIDCDIFPSLAWLLLAEIWIFLLFTIIIVSF